MKKKMNLEELEVDPEKRQRIIDGILKGKRTKEEIQLLGIPENELALLGENRGQLFVRIPKFVKEELKLERGQKVHFIIYTADGKKKLKIEVVEDAT